MTTKTMTAFDDAELADTPIPGSLREGAVGVLRSIMDDVTMPTADRVRAAGVLLQDVRRRNEQIWARHAGLPPTTLTPEEARGKLFSLLK